MHRNRAKTKEYWRFFTLLILFCFFFWYASLPSVESAADIARWFVFTRSNDSREMHFHTESNRCLLFCVTLTSLDGGPFFLHSFWFLWYSVCRNLYIPLTRWKRWALLKTIPQLPHLEKTTLNTAKVNLFFRPELPLLTFLFSPDEQLRRGHPQVTKYGLIDNEDPDPQTARNINLGLADNEVLTTGQSLEPYLQSYVTIPPTSDVSIFSLISTFCY